MYKTLGVIGSGNMGSAIIGGIIKNKFIDSDNIFISDANMEKAIEISNKYKVKALKNNIEIVKNCDAIILAVKPNIYEIVLNEIKDSLLDNCLIVTIAAGISIDYVKRLIGQSKKVIRTMPNTPGLIGQGITGITYQKDVLIDDIEYVKALFSSIGVVEIIEEKYMDAFCSLCGSSPAFVDIFIEAMADAAVYLGIPRNKAYFMASQAVFGSAKMINETGLHPAELKDMVCSPSGTTIEGVKNLEENGFRSAVINAIIKTAEKSKILSEKYK